MPVLIINHVEIASERRAYVEARERKKNEKDNTVNPIVSLPANRRTVYMYVRPLSIERE